MRSISKPTAEEGALIKREWWKRWGTTIRRNVTS